MKAQPAAVAPAVTDGGSHGNRGCTLFQVILVVIIFAAMAVLAGVATSVPWARAKYPYVDGAENGDKVLTFYLSTLETCKTPTSGAPSFATTCTYQSPSAFGFPSATSDGFTFMLVACSIVCALGGLGFIVAVLVLLKETGVLKITIPIMGWIIGFAWLACALSIAVLATWGAVVFPYLLVLSILGDVLPGSGVSTVNLAGLGLMAACVLIGFVWGIWAAVLQCQGVGGPPFSGCCCCPVANGEVRGGCCGSTSGATASAAAAADPTVAGPVVRVMV